MADTGGEPFAAPGNPDKDILGQSPVQLPPFAPPGNKQPPKRVDDDPSPSPGKKY